MKGLELSRAYFEECGLPMLKEQFPQLTGIVAAGLFGSGSECYGYDDDLSQDHDFEPGFCLFLPDESAVDEATAFQLEKAYNKLPREYRGYKRNTFNTVGGNRHGVFRSSDFFKDRVGSEDGILTIRQWLTLPDYVLAEMTNGEIFMDESGLVTEIRKRLSAMPEDIFLKKLAAQILLMNQSGQYNYPRCLAHGETAAAQLAVNEFVTAAMKTVFLLNGTYMPFYKWSFRALREQKILPLTAEILEYLLTGSNDEENAANKIRMIETVTELIMDEIVRRGIIENKSEDLEKVAYAINGKISDHDIRNMDILAGA